MDKDCVVVHFFPQRHGHISSYSIQSFIDTGFKAVQTVLVLDDVSMNEKKRLEKFLKNPSGDSV
jgi:hypothetical protein